MCFSRPGSVAQGSVASDTIESRIRGDVPVEGQTLERSASKNKEAQASEHTCPSPESHIIGVDKPTDPTQAVMSFKSGPDTGLIDSSRSLKRSPSAVPPPLSIRPPAPLIHLPPLPPPPAQPLPDPWDRTISPATDASEQDLKSADRERRESIPIPESPIDPTSPFSLVQGPPIPYRHAMRNDKAAVVEIAQESRNGQSDAEITPSRAELIGSPNPSYPMRDASLGQLHSRSPPTDSTHYGQKESSDNKLTGGQIHPAGSTASASWNQRDSQASSTNASVQSSVFDSTRIDSYYEMASPVSTANRTSTISGGLNSPVVNGSASFAPNHGQQVDQISPTTQGAKHITREAFREESGLQVLHPGNDIPDGLIPVAEELSQPEIEPEVPIRRADLRITEISSFHQLKGFCEGAKEVMRGGLGVKRIKKHVRSRIFQKSYIVTY